MNDHIMQYILEAGTDCSGKWMSLFQAEKLAELIVKECADYAFSDEQDHRAMLKHFGVEE
jgi:hypothetical protein